MKISSAFFLMSSLSIATISLADERTDVINGIYDCESHLIDVQLGNRQIYSGSSCEPYVYDIDRATREYIENGRRDLADANGQLSNLTTDRLKYRLQLCLRTDRDVASIFDRMDRSGCSPYATRVSGYSVESPRVPETTQTNNGSGYYQAGVNYTNSGNVSFGSNGVTYTHSGNVTFGSDGSTYIHSGNVTFGSDGTTYITSGNVTFGSNGTTCISSGTMTTCN